MCTVNIHDLFISNGKVLPRLTSCCTWRGRGRGRRRGPRDIRCHRWAQQICRCMGPGQSRWSRRCPEYLQLDWQVFTGKFQKTSYFLRISEQNTEGLIPPGAGSCPPGSPAWSRGGLRQRWWWWAGLGTWSGDEPWQHHWLSFDVCWFFIAHLLSRVCSAGRYSMGMGCPDLKRI